MTRKDAERQEAIGRLREWLKPGDTVYTIVRHVSRSGMQRTIDCIGIDKPDQIHAYGWNVAKALGWSFDRDREGVKVSGCGMDMGFETVYSMGRVMFPDGFDCIGENCPSNDHNNAYYFKKEGEEVPTHHSDGGYALRQRWL